MTSLNMSRKTKIYLALIILIVILAVISPKILPYHPNKTYIDQRLQPPSSDHPFGTDNYGRDVFSRTLLGSRISILSAILIVVISGGVGTIVGLFSGYYGGRVDQVLMGICDIFLSFPQMILAIGIAGIAGGGLSNAILALTVSNWMKYARLARSQTLKEKTELYVEASRFSGLSDGKILFKHIFINIKDLIFVTMAIDFAAMLIGLAGLSFLGIGVQPPQAEWGSMINGGRLYLRQAPWISFAPALSIILVVFVVNLFGYSLQSTIKKEGESK